MKDGKREVLILHGWMHSAARYEKLKEDLERQADVLVTLYEFPGFGDTPATKYRKDIMEGYCQDLCDDLKDHDWDCIIGHSMGGNIALRAAAANRFGGTLILLSPEYGGIPFLRLLTAWKPVVKLTLNMFKKRSRICTVLIKMMSLFTINRYSRIDGRIVEDVRRADPDTAGELMFQLAGDSWSLKGEELCVEEAVLIIGERDRLIPRSHMIRLRRQLGNCQMYVLKGIGHTAVLEDYEGLMRLLLKRLAV